MDVYAVGDIATALNVSVSTVRNWTEHPVFEPYLSTLALRTGEYTNAKERKYTLDDLYVLNTISIHKTRLNDWNDVARLLEDGTRERDLPESAMLVLPASSSESFYTLARAQERIAMLERRVQELQDELEAERAKDSRADLHEQIGALKFILKQHSIDAETGKKTED